MKISVLVFAVRFQENKILSSNEFYSNPTIIVFNTISSGWLKTIWTRPSLEILSILITTVPYLIGGTHESFFIFWSIVALNCNYTSETVLFLSSWTLSSKLLLTVFGSEQVS